VTISFSGKALIHEVNLVILRYIQRSYDEYFDLRDRSNKDGENYIMRSVIICTLRQILLRWSKQG